MKSTLRKFVILLLELLTPITFLSSLWLKIVRKVGVGKIGDKIFMTLGILPVLDHYYQPMINPKKHLSKSLRADRELKGIDFNVNEQLDLLSKFNYNDELLKFSLHKNSDIEYSMKMVLTSQAMESICTILSGISNQRIIEIGSGFSTLMVRNAIAYNKIDDSKYTCNHICIEPYEQPWLAKLEVELIRKKVESIDKSFFQKLESNDILFIDSSHIIRPQGDVLFEYLELLPTLKSGVLIHVHDIFTPKDYLNEWIYKQHLLWNEQYLLEAFLIYNSQFKIIGALNYLTHNYLKEFAEKCPIFAKQPG